MDVKQDVIVDPAAVVSATPKPSGKSVAPIKPEFVCTREALAETMRVVRGDPKPTTATPTTEATPDASKAVATDANADEAGLTKSQKKRRKRGRNKSRPVPMREAVRLCGSIAKGKECPFGEKCRFEHDTEVYLAAKLPDLEGTCPFWRIQGGQCRYGITCRYASTHTPLTEEELKAKQYDDVVAETESNQLTLDLRHILRKNKYKVPKSDVYLREFAENNNTPKYATLQAAQEAQAAEDQPEGAIADKEKKAIDWDNKLYLAPLTTVGNLPFRRVCKQFGVDITCGEMALGLNLLQGSNSEWALIRRHESEDVFGAQICGNNTTVMTKVAELLSKETDIDFIDLNCGCPIDLVYKQGSGSAMLNRKKRLHGVLRGMVDVSSVPITIKVRTGVAADKPVMHQLAPELHEWGVSALTIHGRSREQRYTKYADWEYIDKCSKTVPDLPVYGNGDILSWEDAKAHREETGVRGLMVARGALIKPWIFTEIKQERDWDISSGERFDMYKDYCKFGLEHWGSDLQGVERTRRFLLELMSFTHRYIPVGLLERLPARMNERPPWFVGRNDMETWLSSSMSEDWVRLSEMLLGPAPPGFEFLPKHKANSYA
eukprot:m.120569 g.120569  ORF g.120569 m.120569 type:complete len:604 (+) comp15615_c0_seq25:59-1870(+)